jgi:hypothetical protein
VKSAIEMHQAKHALRQRMRWLWGGKHTQNWHGLPRGVLGIGFGVKRAGGKVAEEHSIRVYVAQKKLTRHIPRKHRVPKTIDGYLTDVTEVRVLRPHQGPGDSLSNRAGTGGTLTCVVKDQDGQYLLGSWHVLTNTAGKDGDPVFMPSTALSPNAQAVADLVGTPHFFLNGGSDAFDAAVAQIRAGIDIDPQLGPGTRFGAVAQASTGLKVIKRGAATGQTSGTIDGLAEDIVVTYNNELADRAVLTRQMFIVGDGGPFSAEGDSGSMVYTEDFHPVGMLVGGSVTQANVAGPHSFASPIQPILDFYGVSIV